MKKLFTGTNVFVDWCRLETQSEFAFTPAGPTVFTILEIYTVGFAGGRLGGWRTDTESFAGRRQDFHGPFFEGLVLAVQLVACLHGQDTLAAQIE